MTGHNHRILSSLLLLLGLTACATTGSQTAERMDQQEAENREELGNLKRAVDASYERESAMAERLRTLEERLRTLEELRQEMIALKRQLEGMEEVEPAKTPVFSSTSFDVRSRYKTALRNYKNRRYDKALGQFAEILNRAPYNDLADNAQYWIGECYYGMGKYNQALTEFTKVFAYAKTGKADDAQFKIARCYMNLGKKEKALMAFQKLLDEYPESEYLSKGLKEMEFLQGP